MAQGPVLKRINYRANVTYRLGEYTAPPGAYVIYQQSRNDVNLFGLYENDVGREPIAIIRTIPIDYSVSGYPDKARVFLETDESDIDARPVLRGWTIPGEGGWEVISVIRKNSRVLTKAN
jgi:hypothetical protein